MVHWPCPLEDLEMNCEFWKGRRVLLTGHTGFKGSWLSLWLHHLGAKVAGYALQPPTTPSLFTEADIAAVLHSVEGDIRDLPRLRQTLQDFQPEIVLHLAAQALVGQSYKDPVETYSTNVMGTVNLFEAIRSTPSVRAVVNITTDKCYENQEWIWGYRETDALGGFDPYSNSKACAELVTAAFRSSFFHPDQFESHHVAIATARAGNVIGGGDWASNRLVPDILQGLASGVAADIRNPGSVRPWQHVLEPLRGYLMLAERLVLQGPVYGGPWNFGPRRDDAKPVSWLADELCAIWGAGAHWRNTANELAHETTALRLDTSKSESLLGWLPVLTLQESLLLIVEWSQSRATGTDVRQLTLAQIAHYQERVTSHVD